MKFSIRDLLLVTVIVALAVGWWVRHAPGEEWGDVVMTFKYDGKPPEPRPAGPGRLAIPPRDETWVVGKEGGVKNVVVRLLPPQEGVPIHPDFEKAKGTDARIDIVNGFFQPRVAIKYTHQNLVFDNKDPFDHNIQGDLFRNKSFNILIPANRRWTLDAKRDELDQHETGPARLSDSIYGAMQGYLFVLAHPYAAVSDEKGKLTIKNVPTGERTFVMWHEAEGYIKQGALDDRAAEWPKGRIKVKVAPEANTVGTIRFKQLKSASP